MSTKSDPQLLREYAGRRSEAAFTELVSRHLDLVHSAALRITGDAHLAQDVSQGVFVALAKSAGKLAAHPVLSGWLHTTTRNIAAQAIRGEARRRKREQQAATMHVPSETEPAWDEIAPHLDAALSELPSSDRDAVLLRYFENQSARDIATVLGISPEAAQKRVNRGVEKLRERLAKRGITAATAGLTGVISANAVQTAPAGLAAGVLSGLGSAVVVPAHPFLGMLTMKNGLVAAAVATFTAVMIHQAISHLQPTEKEAPSQATVSTKRNTRERSSLVERINTTRSEQPPLDRKMELERLKKRWLEVGNENEKVPEQDALAKESAALLMCAPEILELLDFLTRNDFRYGVAKTNSEVGNLFSTSKAKEARELLVQLPETTKIKGERSYSSGTEPYRDRWSNAAGETCPDDEFESFCAALNCTSCAMEAVYGRSKRLMASDPEKAITSALDAFKSGVSSISGRFGVTELFRSEFAPNIDFKKLEEQLPPDGPKDESRRPFSDENAFTEIRRKLFWSWGERDPAAAAANHVMANPSRLPPQLMEEIVGGHSYKNPNGIIAWIATFPAGPYFDAAARSAACYVRWYPGIHELIQNIQDPKQRQEAEERVKVPAANPNTQ